MEKDIAEIINDETKLEETPSAFLSSVSASGSVSDAGSEAEKYSHLTREEAAILKAQIHNPQHKISFFTLYRYRTAREVICFIIAFIASICGGVLLPMSTIVVGSLTNDFTNFFLGQESPDKYQRAVDHNTLYFVYFGAGLFVANFIHTFFHSMVGEVLTGRIRRHYLYAILHQNIAYFDKLGVGEITERITTDTNLVQDGISDKIGVFVESIAQFFTAFIIGFVKGWKLTLILMSGVVVIFGFMGGCSRFIVKYVKQSLGHYAEASTVAEEVFSSIRNVVAFGTQERHSVQYNSKVIKARNSGYRKGIALATMVAAIWGTLYLMYALAFWMGSRLVVSGEMDIGRLVTVVLASVIGSVSLGTAAPHMQNLAEAVGAASKIFATIDRKPYFDTTNERQPPPLRIPDLQGRITLNHVRAVYPSRPDNIVLQDLSLDIQPGQTVALVGPSGSGKSTVVGLLERFYDHIGGEILIDGHDIRELDVKWWRQQMALVSQEPVLFSCSLRENIEYGLIGTPHENASPEVKAQLVEAACREANAWGFINSMTEGLETNVGERGFLLSGGQKQRIAIARAIVSQPKILLLDEATSALDTKSEGVVQDALDKAAKSRTTIVIAHRLSTVKDADLIVVMSKGEVVERGTHSELMAKKGVYYSLVEAQQIGTGNTGKSGAAGSEAGAEAEADDDVVAEYTPEDGHALGKSVSRGAAVSRISTAASYVRDPEKGGETASLSSQILAERPPPVLPPEPTLISAFNFVAQFNKPERPFFFIGFAAAIVTGGGYPTMGVLFAKIIMAFQVTPEHYSEMRHHVNMYTGFLFMLAMLCVFAYLTLIGLLSYCTERLVWRIRVRTLEQLMRQEVAFFDDEEHSTGALTAMLAKDAQDIEGLGGGTMGQILSCVVTLVAGICVALAFNWRLGLIGTACVPLLVGCGFLRVWVIQSSLERNLKAYQASASYACEATSSLRTVAALTREIGVWEEYSEQISHQLRKSVVGYFRSAVLFGLSQMLVPWIMALTFWYGGTQIRKGQITPFQFYVAFISLIVGAQLAGSVFSYAPGVGKARQGAGSIFRIFQSTPSIDTSSPDGKTVDPETVEGVVEFRDVHFRYPTRPQVPVLRGLNLSVQRGQYVGLVGASGCGKSTTISLVERFYDPLAGSVLLDGHDIREYNVNEYRKCIALVQQEPMLYSGTIRDNILMGTWREDVTDAEIEAACRKANIHEFIMSLSDGYDTICGSRGSMLSGGQKQRVAIARALIRDPKILLLDEATSALDSESEKVVQAALDEAAKGRTTIAVAHRLSTIQNADVIYVFDDGKIAEQGTHNELMALKGRYYDMVKLQTIEE